MHPLCSSPSLLLQGFPDRRVTASSIDSHWTCGSNLHPRDSGLEHQAVADGLVVVLQAGHSFFELLNYVSHQSRYGPWIRGGLDQEGFLTKVKMRKNEKT